MSKKLLPSIATSKPFIPEPYQKVALDWMMEKGICLYLGGCGLGKTVVTLKHIANLFDDLGCKGVLVLAPLRVSTLTWPDEVAKWGFSKHLRVVSLRTEEGLRAWDQGSADIYTLNYEKVASREKPRDAGLTWSLCENLLRGAKSLPVDMIVFDEVSKMKDVTSKRVKALMPFMPMFDHRIGLTGTPASNNLLDIFAQVKLIDGGQRLGKSFEHFKRTYFEATDWQQYNWVPREGAREMIYARLADLALVQRSEDYLDIPETTHEEVEVTLDAASMSRYKEMQKEFLLELENGAEIEAVNAAVLVNKLLQMTGGHIYDEGKVPQFLHQKKFDALKKILKKNSPLLVATNYIHERDFIVKNLKEAEAWAGDETLARWNAGEIKCLVVHAGSVGHGLNMQGGGNTVCWYSSNWSLELDEQFMRRVARKGQENPTKVIRLVVPGTVDVAVVESLRSKDKEQDSLLLAVKALQTLSKST